MNPEYLTPGVYVEELNPPHRIPGAPGRSGRIRVTSVPGLPRMQELAARLRRTKSGGRILCAGSDPRGRWLAARALALELQLGVFRVELGRVASQYIGETEKHLAGLFAAAERSGAILFFDEADALFGKRSEVKTADDRFANLDTAWLLERIENYDGLVILATNRKAKFDPAFLRKCRLRLPIPRAKLRRLMKTGRRKAKRG